MKSEKTALDSIAIQLLKLEPIVTVLQLTTESFGLDNLELTEANKYNLVHRADMIGDVLELTKSTIRDVVREIESIIDDAYSEKDSGESTDTTVTTK